MEGERLRQRRKELKLSGEKVAQALRTTKVTVSRWEKGTSEPSDEMKLALAKILNTSASYLIGETDDPSPILSSGSMMKSGIEERPSSTPEIEDVGVNLIIQTNDHSREIVSKPGHLTFRNGDVLIDIPDTPENKKWFNEFLNSSIKTERTLATA